MHHFVTLDYYLLLCALAAGLLVRPTTNFLEVRYVFVAGTLLGYCGEGLIELLGGDQLKNRLMYPPMAPVVYRYVAALTLAFWVGYHVTRWRYVPKVGPGDGPRIRPPNVRLLILLAVIPLVLEIVVYGSDLIVGTDDQVRGALAQDVNNRPVEFYLRVISRVLAFPLSVAAGLAWKETRRSICWLVPTLLSLPLIAQFSRGMFLPFVAALLGVVLVTTGKRRLAYIALAVGLVVSSFVIGIAMREYARTAGLGHFADLLRGDEAVAPTPVSHGFDTPLVSLVHATTALPRATLAFEIGPRIEGHKKFGYVLRQLPIPSFMLPASVPATNLTSDLNLKKKTGVKGAGFPYPLVAEMKVFLGWFGCFVFMAIGWGAAKVDNLMADPRWLRTNQYLAAIIYGLALNFIIRSFHGGLRSSFRPIMYVSFAWFVWWLWKKLRTRPTRRTHAL